MSASLPDRLRLLADGSRFALGIAFTLLPTVLWAAEAGAEREGWFTLIMRFINFGLLAGILYYFLRKPVRNFLNQRQQGVGEALEEAQRAREEAEARCRDLDKKLAEAQKEMEALRQTIVDQGKTEKEKIITSAKQEAERLRRQAEIMAAQELKKAQHLLREETVELAAGLAKALLKDRIEAKDHERLIQDYLETLRKASG